MSDSPPTTPPGWYPDPAGGRQWRIWNGSDWTAQTRPYGTPVAPAPTTTFDPANLDALWALRRLAQFGVPAYYAGLALVVSALAFWPGRSPSTTPRVADVMVGVGVGLLLLGSIAVATALRALRGRWRWDAVLPVVNTFVLSFVMSRRLGLSNATSRVVLDGFVTFVFLTLVPGESWFDATLLGLAMGMVAFNQLARAYALADRLGGTAPSAS